MTITEVIAKLGLTPLEIEGGFFRETYRSAHSTAIYYLISEESFSALHIVGMDEIFHFYAGSPVEMFQILPDGSAKTILIGNHLSQDEIPQVVVPKGVWQGTRLAKPGKDKWALLGCTVAPAFEYEQFLIKSRVELQKTFPHHAEQITRFTVE